MKNFLFVLLLGCFQFITAQNENSDLLNAKFSYLLTAKPNKLYPDRIYKEYFSLQVGNNRAFYISEDLLKYDSIFTSEFSKAIKSEANNINMSVKSLPKRGSNYVIIQTAEKSQYYEKIGMVLLSAVSPTISDWRLIDEKKLINTIECLKAQVHYKGRDWVAWYAPNIPFPYGPHKFSGLPGLIVKLTDSTGDYDFELVEITPKSQLSGRVVNVSKRWYENAKIVSKSDIRKARNDQFENRGRSLEELGAALSPEQKENFRLKQKQNEIDKQGYNPLELED